MLFLKLGFLDCHYIQEDFLNFIRYLHLYGNYWVAVAAAPVPASYEAR